MSYIEDIQSFSPLSLNELIGTAKKYVPNQYKRMPWAYPGLDHNQIKDDGKHGPLQQDSGFHAEYSQ